MGNLKAAKTLLRLAKARDIQITTAESCTGGLLAGAITEIAGASDIFERGFVTYSNDAKIDMLGVQATILDAHGAVSEPVALEMAIGAQARAGADLALSITGIAGPGASEHKPEGRVCFGLVRRHGVAHAHTIEFGAIGRSQVRNACVAHALGLLIDALDG